MISREQRKKGGSYSVCVGEESGGVEDSAYREEWWIVGHVTRTWT